jgi:hypothetical protein
MEVFVRARAPRRLLSPRLLPAVISSRITQKVLCQTAGWPWYQNFHKTLRSERVVATALTVTRLMTLADLVGFPRDEIFIDEPQASPRAAVAASVNDAEAAR